MGKILEMKDGKARWSEVEEVLPEGYPYREAAEVVAYDAAVPQEDIESYYGVAYANDQPGLAPLVAGKTYRVEYTDSSDGAELGHSFEVEAVAGSSGEISLGSAGSGDYPRPDHAVVVTYFSDEALSQAFSFVFGSVNYAGGRIRVSCKDEAIHTMDPEYLPTEMWSFELEDGSVVVKKVVVAE